MRRLLLFAKRPRAGFVKTRLVPSLSAPRALRLYRAFLDDQLTLLESFAERCRVAWWVDGDPRLAARALGRARRIEVRDQGPGDLGARLLRAFEHGRREGATATVIVGADSPTLPAEIVRAAFTALEGGADAVLAPADDGGYVLLGAAAPLPPLFRDVPWGGPEVARTTRERARAAGIALAETAGWHDVDDARGLRRLIDEMAGPSAAARAPATRACLLDLGLLRVV